jgi:hypothetical protein
MDLNTLADQTTRLVSESRALINRIAATWAYGERIKVARKTYRVIEDARLTLERADILIGWVDAAPQLHGRVPPRGRGGDKPIGNGRRKKPATPSESRVRAEEC